MNNDLISVIIPVYKVEVFLDKCVESIINQTYDNLEILLVDDGSPDSCPKMCDSWAKKDKRIKVIHKENGGLSDARNVGIENCSGNYILFVDSDDWIPKNAIEILFSNLIDSNADISTGVLKDVFKREYDSIELNNNYIVLNKEEALEKLMYIHNITTSASGKIFKRNLFEHIKFPVGKHFEDLGTIYKVFALSNKVVSSDMVVYYYYQNNNSIVHKRYTNKRLEAYDFAIEELNFIKQNYPNILNAAIFRLFYECLSILNDMPIKCCNKKLIKKTIKKYRKNVIHDKKINKKQRLLCYSSLFGQIFIKLVFKIKNKLK